MMPKTMVILVGLLLAMSALLLGQVSLFSAAEVPPVWGTTPAPDTGIQVPEVVPAVNTTKHSVPLEEIYFDTFQPVNRAMPLSEASPELIQRLRDAIPPIHNPKYETVSDATWMRDRDVVLGYAGGHQAWAYPIRILNFHEIVNDALAGEEVLISYCPLCYTGVVHSRNLGDRVLTFGNTRALFESDMVMLDYETGSYWWQVAGEAIVGPLTGRALTILPSQMTTWEEWRELYPETLVLSRDNGYARDYNRNFFTDYIDSLNRGRFAFPVSEAGMDARLPPATKVMAVKVGAETRAYPLVGLGQSVVEESVGGLDIVVFIDADGPTGIAFEPVGEGEALTFEFQDDALVNLETGSVWDFAGRAVSGPLQGQQLNSVPSLTSFWFAIVAAEPDITVYLAEPR